MLAISSEAVTAKEIRDELEILLKSERFARSERQSSFLKYLCEAHIEGKTEDLKEYRIALEVFNRRTDHSPTEDSIVRVQVHELRRRLKEYYSGEGKYRPVRLSIPKGGYAPEFTRLRADDTLQPQPQTPPPIAPPKTPAAATSSRKIWITVAVVSLVVNCLLLALWLKPASARATTQSRSYQPYREMFGVLHGTPRETLICLSNPQVFLLDQRQQPTAGQPPGMLTLTPEMRRLLDKEGPNDSRWALFPTSDEYTGTGEAVAAYEIGRLTQRINLPSRLSQGRFLNWDRAREENLIVLGLPRATPWTRNNISSKFFETTDDGLRLKSPASGQTLFGAAVAPATGEVISDYAVITKEMTPTGSWNMILAGNSSVGTYGAGEFLCDPGKMKLVFEKLKSLNKGGLLPDEFLVVIKIAVHENIPTAMSLVDCQLAR